MLENILTLMLVIALILNLKEYKKMVKRNEEVYKLTQDLIETKSKLNRKYNTLGILLMQRYDECINKCTSYGKDINKFRHIFNKTKKIRIKKKAAKRILINSK